MVISSIHSSDTRCETAYTLFKITVYFTRNILLKFLYICGPKQYANSYNELLIHFLFI